MQVLMEQSTHIRTKAMKCMTMIVTEDPEVLFRKDMQSGVNWSFNDASTMVREAAVDLVGRKVSISGWVNLVKNRWRHCG